MEILVWFTDLFTFLEIGKLVTKVGKLLPALIHFENSELESVYLYEQANKVYLEKIHDTFFLFGLGSGHLPYI